MGFRLWELSANLSQSDDPEVVLLPEMEHLRDVLEETVSLYVRDGLERIRIQAVQSNQTIRRVAQVGARLPLYVGASSKVLVAFADSSVVEQVLASPSWPSTLDKEVFLRQMEEVREWGYATSVEEREVGAAAVAVPIYNRSQKLAAALAVSGPSNRLTLEKMQAQAPVLIEFAARMGKMLK
ncbi:HTH-type transcriptional repressor AllR [compost metagenome]